MMYLFMFLDFGLDFRNLGDGNLGSTGLKFVVDLAIYTWTATPSQQTIAATISL